MDGISSFGAQVMPDQVSALSILFSYYYMQRLDCKKLTAVLSQNYSFIFWMAQDLWLLTEERFFGGHLVFGGLPFLIFS